MKIGYSKTFPIIGKEQWEKIWIEDEVTGTEEDARQSLYKLKRQVESFHYESNKAAEKEAGIKEPMGTPDGVIDLINKCATIPKPHGLMAFEIIAKTDKAIQQAWDAKFKELSQQTK